jgi:hypothetical protein
MPVEPTPEASARHLLDVFACAHNDKLRAGQVLSRGPAKTEFLKDRQWHVQDFVAGLHYASEHHWIKIPSPTVIRLTEDGFRAAM